jgi:hypothetical protein
MHSAFRKTVIAVGYMQNDAVNIVQNFTNDHTQAAKALRLPLGNAGVSASPYLSWRTWRCALANF